MSMKFVGGISWERWKALADIVNPPNLSMESEFCEFQLQFHPKRLMLHLITARPLRTIQDWAHLHPRRARHYALHWELALWYCESLFLSHLPTFSFGSLLRLWMYLKIMSKLLMWKGCSPWTIPFLYMSWVPNILYNEQNLKWLYND